MTGHFDENDKESWYFGSLTLDESKELLANEDVGVFLVRDSTRGGFVLCVREEEEVKQYPIKTTETEKECKFFIRDELAFRDLPSMLAFYKRNLFESTALVRPISRENVDTVVPPNRRRIHSEIPAGFSSKLERSGFRISAPVGAIASSESTPGFARVTKAKTPSVYSNHLELHVGDIITITQIHKDGTGEGELRGKHGRFPLTHVERILPSECNK